LTALRPLLKTIFDPPERLFDKAETFRP